MCDSRGMFGYVVRMPANDSPAVSVTSNDQLVERTLGQEIICLINIPPSTPDQATTAGGGTTTSILSRPTSNDVSSVFLGWDTGHLDTLYCFLYTT